MRSVRPLVLAVALALAGAALVVGAPDATTTPVAQPICVSASVTALVVGTHTVAPPCVPYGDATICNHREGGLSGTLYVTNDICVPRP